MRSNRDRKPQSPESKERIIQAATSLFARHGFAETGMRELVTEADVNLSMVNYYFGSKRGLLKVILDNFFAGYLNIARKELIGDKSVSSKLEQFISQAVLYFEAEHDSMIIALSELPHDDPEIVKHKSDWARQMLEIVSREICQPLAAESGEEISPAIFSPMLTFLMASRFFIMPVIKQVAVGSTNLVSTEVYTKTIIRILLQGVANPDRNTAQSQC